MACTAFHLLTGAAPYVDSNPAVVISQHIAAPPPALAARRPELAALDPVFATAMAKQPAHRFGSCRKFADQLAAALGAAPSTPGAAPFPDTQPAMDATVPALRPTAARRPRLLLGALAAIALLVVAAGVFAGVKLLRHPDSRRATEPNPTGAQGNSASPAPNTGPFTGVYQAHFGQGGTLDDVHAPAAVATTDTYAVRSACGPTGCRATSARLSGELRLASTSVFDEVDGRWVAVSIGSDRCRDAPTAEVWHVLTLQPRPDGTLIGEYRGASENACNEKRTVTFTRTGDVDITKLPDPGALPPRVASPAEALHGRYHVTRKFKKAIPPQQGDQAVVTDCLRTGDRCMSYLHSKTIDTPLLFAGGVWNLHVEHDDNDPGCGGPVYAKATGQYPLPQPPRDPVAVLTGHNHLDESGGPNCQWSLDYNETLTRTGD